MHVSNASVGVIPYDRDSSIKGFNAEEFILFVLTVHFPHFPKKKYDLPVFLL
jgi:hypothetical protein